MKIIIAGGRDFVGLRKHAKWLDQKVLPSCTEVVSGGARGADNFGERWAASHHLPVRVFPARWKTFGRAAGYIRNGEMASYADAVVLFPGGRGTAHMEQHARENGLQIWKWPDEPGKEDDHAAQVAEFLRRKRMRRLTEQEVLDLDGAAPKGRPDERGTEFTPSSGTPHHTCEMCGCRIEHSASLDGIHTRNARRCDECENEQS